jgi:hypothetical protein
VGKLSYTQIFDRLWGRYAKENPSVKRIYELFGRYGEVAENDHVVFRILNDPKVHINVIARLFKAIGYKAVGK